MSGRPPDHDAYAVCTACKAKIPTEEEVRHSIQTCHRFAWFAFLLLVPCFVLPLVRFEYFGEPPFEAGLIGMVHTFSEHGMLELALAVGILSGLLPFVFLLVLIRVTTESFVHGRHGRLWHWLIKTTEKFGMAEVFLSCMAIFAGKLSNMFTVEMKPFMAVFFLMVILKLIATMHFKPRIFRYRFKERS
jgi:uncharacterized paraquat-inducible protein A